MTQVQDHQRGEKFEAERRRAGCHQKPNVPSFITHMEIDRIADEALVSRKLLDARADGVGRDHEIVEERIRTERRHPRDLEPDVWREPLLLRARDEPSQRLARNPRIHIVEI